jgi:hypothetical protein
VTRIDVTMEIGAMGDNVTVRAEAPALQTETAEVHSNLLGQELTNLPVPLGGNYQQVYRNAARLCTAGQFALDPDQPGTIAGI